MSQSLTKLAYLTLVLWCTCGGALAESKGNAGDSVSQQRYFAGFDVYGTDRLSRESIGNLLGAKLAQCIEAYLGRSFISYLSKPVYIFLIKEGHLP